VKFDVHKGGKGERRDETEDDGDENLRKCYTFGVESVALSLRVWGFGVWGLGFGVWGLGFGVWGQPSSR